MLWLMAMARVNDKPTEVVRHLLSTGLENPVSLCALTSAELDLTLRVARRASVMGYLAHRLRESGRLNELPQAAIDQLDSAAVDAHARSRVVSWEENRIDWALGDVENYPVVLLKGAAYLALELPNAPGRLLSDLDLLVPENKLRDAEERLDSRGWQFGELTPYDDRYYRLWSHELPPLRHVERETEVDLHHTILQPTSRLSPPATLLFEDARPVPGIRFYVLSPIDMVLHAMTHLFFDGEIADSLRDLLDIDIMLRHFAEREEAFWERIWPRAEELDLTRPTFYGLRYSNRLLGTPVPDYVLRKSYAGAPPAPVRRFMDFLVPKALFPQHPDKPGRWSSLARFLLYIRSHWIRMPPLLLARHLSVKFYVRHLKGRVSRLRPERKSATAGP
jgi:hypothetical protein